MTNLLGACYLLPDPLYIFFPVVWLLNSSHNKCPSDIIKKAVVRFCCAFKITFSVDVHVLSKISCRVRKHYLFLYDQSINRYDYKSVLKVIKKIHERPCSSTNMYCGVILPLVYSFVLYTLSFTCNKTPN